MSVGVPDYLDGVLPVTAQLAQWAFVLVVWFVALRKVLRTPAPLNMRALMLEQAVRESGSELLIDKAGPAHFVELENARQAQLANARKDRSPFVQLGTSTGLLAQRRDPLARLNPACRLASRCRTCLRIWACSARAAPARPRASFAR